MPLSAARKKEYFTRMTTLLDTYSKVLVVGVDNVGSKQCQKIRMALRGEGEVLMGKNTMMRKVMRQYLDKNPGHPYEQLIDHIMGNVGFIFTNGDLTRVRDLLEENVVPAPARVGAVAPIDVVVPAGPTGCDPGQTAFFQTLQVATKITKGQIEIVSPMALLKVGDRVGNSEAALLQKLGIDPFTYGMVVKSIYDNGSIFDAAVLDITEEVLIGKFLNAVRHLASVSLAIGYPTHASIPHSIANAFKTIMAVTVECENYTFEKAEPFKAFLADPSAFVVAAPAAAAEGAGDAAAAAPEEEEEAEDVDLGGGMDMFGGGDGGDY